ncbi:small-conductance mechanosensitive channel [Candidatus Nitrososphaera evergladensis SR1]|uniref:Small-conductance mechanosensitive channel n=1 Tax=Candidatus Nitrososphaera evergladensis SR1 TaxID=1459636 RepID=A0A075MVR4_9ARCH|nr:mechanosensitive ion channel family protein [Candidatus Nitrososphaera evergladensis]AIF83399.1 small-conductance mechanosensitive channel [Candidatus Nitrososphaera evergladensis SR1]
MAAEEGALSSGNSSATSVFGLPSTIDLFGVQVTPFSIILTLAIIVAGFAIAHAVRLVTLKYLGTRLPPDARKATGRTMYYGIIAIALLSALGVSGLDLSGLFLAGGFAGIVIGFATQSLFSNLISGIFLHIDKPMKIGDPVLITGKLPDVTGVVVEITALSSRLRMFDGTLVRLPNSDVFLSEIRNLSTVVARRIEFVVGVSYDSDTQKVMEIIRQSLKNTPLVLVEPEPDVYVNDLGASAVNINVWCWVPFVVWFDMKKQLVEQIKRELDSKGIEIPFPQQVVYVREEGRRRKKAPWRDVPSNTAQPGPGSSAGVNLEEAVDKND